MPLFLEAFLHLVALLLPALLAVASVGLKQPTFLLFK
jgi:hypothetical protein